MPTDAGLQMPPYKLPRNLMHNLRNMLEAILFSLEEHDQSCKDHVNMWYDNVLKMYEDDVYKEHATDMKRLLKLKASDQVRYLYYYFKTVPTLKEYVPDNTLPELKDCIQKVMVLRYLHQ